MALFFTMHPAHGCDFINTVRIVESIRLLAFDIPGSNPEQGAWFRSGEWNLRDFGHGGLGKQLLRKHAQIAQMTVKTPQIGRPAIDQIDQTTLESMPRLMTQIT